MKKLFFYFTLFFTKIKKISTSSKEGFSLIELAIVLVIMGLLLGSIIKGKELVDNARLKKVMVQINEIRLASQIFIDTYDALPGDFSNATSLFGEKIINGNGNGLIEGQGLAEGSEALAFWSHLYAADLLPSPGRIEDLNVGNFGKGAPISAIGGGFTIAHNPPLLDGIWIILGKKYNQQGTGGLLTPSQAFSIDKKMDNGIPTSGRVRAFDGMDVTSSHCLTSSGEYNLHVKEPVCILYFQL